MACQAVEESFITKRTEGSRFLKKTLNIKDNLHLYGSNKILPTWIPNDF